jgi:carbamoyl-phosphate synthase small subunit
MSCVHDDTEGFSTPKTAENPRRRAVLILEDGTIMHGEGFGADRKVQGEFVFNTGMVGYPESITDPSYAGQILIQTYPLIGNYGVNTKYLESDRPKIEGYVVHELCHEPSHWSSELQLDEWLAENGVPGIAGVDTRFLTQKIRTQGTMLGILSVYKEEDKLDLQSLREEVKTVEDPNKRKLAYEVGSKDVKRFPMAGSLTVVLIDCGVKLSIIRNLMARGLNVVAVPPETSAEAILAMQPDGVVLSNGPGDPKVYVEMIEATKKLVDSHVPIMGICLGCQILALALGGETYKLKFGHRGQNHPCIEVDGKRCFITSQNHGFAVEPESLKGTGLKVTLLNANDRTVEGIRHVSLPIFAVQFHPEASPGPNDTNLLFDEFLEEVRKVWMRHA